MAVSFTCRGILRDDIRAKIKDVHQRGYPREAQLMDDANRGILPGEPYVHFVEQRKVNGYITLISHWTTGELKPFVVRPVCGYDFQQTIDNGPHDGEQHEYVCPKCGVKGVYTPMP